MPRSLEGGNESRFREVTTMKRVIGLLLMTLLLGVAAGGGAAAGGGSGGGAEGYITFTPGAFTLTHEGEVILTGTVTCTLPGEAQVSAGVQQVTGEVVSDNPYDYQYHGLLVSGGGEVTVECPTPGTHDVALMITAEQQRGFRPGDARVFLEFDSVAHDPATGYDYPSSQFGILDIALTPAHGS
jgi:hypothetical protein